MSGEGKELPGTIVRADEATVSQANTRWARLTWLAQPELFLATCLVSLIYSPAFAMLILAVFYLVHFNSLLRVERTPIRRNFLYGFLASIGLVLLQLINGLHVGHFDLAGIIYENRYYYVSFLAFFPLLDFVYCVSRSHRLNVRLLQDYILAGVCIATFLVLAEKFLFGSPLNGLNGLLEFFSSRRVGERSFATLNQNHQDDFYIYVVVLLVWTSLLKSRMAAGNRYETFLVAALTAMFFLMFLTGGSRAGLAGFAAGIIFLASLVFLKQRRILSISALSFLMILPIPDLLPAGPGSVPGSVLSPDRNANQSFLQPLHTISQQSTPLSPDASDAASDKPKTPGRTPSWVLCDLESGVATSYALKDPSIILRLEIYRIAWGMWLERPILGHGGYDNRALAEGMSERDTCITHYLSHVHNQYLDLAVRGGILMFLMYLGMTLYMLISLVRTYAESRKTWHHALPLIGYVVYILVENLFDANFARNDYLMAINLGFWMMIALTLFNPEKPDTKGTAQPSAGR